MKTRNRLLACVLCLALAGCNAVAKRVLREDGFPNVRMFEKTGFVVEIRQIEIKTLDRHMRPVRFDSTRDAGEHLVLALNLASHTDNYFGPMSPPIGVFSAPFAAVATVLALPWDIVASPFRRDTRVTLDVSGQVVAVSSAPVSVQTTAILWHELGSTDFTGRRVDLSSRTLAMDSGVPFSFPIEMTLGRTSGFRSAPACWVDLVSNRILHARLKISRRGRRIFATTYIRRDDTLGLVKDAEFEVAEPGTG